MNMSNRTTAQAIHGALVAREHCRKSGNPDWLDRWTRYLDRIAHECLPSGSGVDGGTKIRGLTTDGRGFVLSCGFHHMNEHGYNGWTYHTVYVRPDFSGLELRVTGRDRNNVKDDLGELFDQALSAPAPDVSPQH